jgi:hypothetical protein
VADQLRAKFPKLSALMDEAENDVLAFMTFPRAHWAQIYSTNPLERLNAEIKRRTNVVGIFPNDAAIVRLVGAMTDPLRYCPDSAVRSGTLSSVYLSLSGLWTYTTSWDMTELLAL